MVSCGKGLSKSTKNGAIGGLVSKILVTIEKNDRYIVITQR